MDPSQQSTDDVVCGLDASAKPPITHRDVSPRLDVRAAGVGVALAVAAAGCPPPPEPDDGAPVPLSPLLRRLVNRITYGLNAHEAALANDLGYEGYLEYHLDYLNIDDSACTARLRAFGTLDDTPAQFVRAVDSNFEVAAEFIFAMFVRSLHSRRQLFERMVEFWSDHFNIFVYKDNVHYVKPFDDRDVIRAHALGAFPDLAMASSKSPAMLVYLDNTSSTYLAPNQNYGRELLELHTVGVENYTQFDVEEVARCFTGYTVNLRQNSPDLGRFLFDPDLHDDGSKRVLGRDISAGGGVTDGERVIEILTQDPEIAPLTARFVGRKLAVHFWGYDPPDALVDEIAQAYLDTGGDIRAMIRAALAPSWLEQAPEKLKRPYHFAISALRTRPAQLNNYRTFSYILEMLSNHPFYWPPPNGYPDTLEHWGTFLLPRWSYGVWMAYPDDAKDYDITPFESAPSGEAFLQAIDDYLFNGALPATEYAQLQAHLTQDPNNIWLRYEVLGLAFSMPSFQWV